MSIAILVAALAVGFQNERPWQTVVSKEGQFVVSFPTKPTLNESKDEQGPSGPIKVLLVGAETPAAAYIIQKIAFPTAVIPGAEQKALDEFRDWFVNEFKGKVLSEKRVSFEGKPGRDYTIRATPTPGGPTSTVRVRQFLAGQGIYILYAVSADNRELPNDIGKFFGSFAIGTTRSKKTGPKPEPAGGKVLAGWGTVIDPDGDCSIARDGNALAVDVPGTLHDLNADIDRYNAPRVLQQVEGDFTAQVKVVGEFTPGAKSWNPKSVPFNGAGIFVWSDSDNYIRLERATILRNGKPGTFAVFEEREGGSTGALHNGNLAPGDAYLKLERRGNRIFGFTSKDGKTWVALRPIDTLWPPRMKVGLDAINSSDAPFRVRFEEYSLRRNGPPGTSPRP